MNLTKKRLMLATIAVLATFSPALADGKWWEDNFIIGCLFDPPYAGLDNTEVKDVYKKAQDAQFNLYLGQQVIHNNTKLHAIDKNFADSYRKNSYSLWWEQGMSPTKDITDKTVKNSIETNLKKSCYNGFYYVDEPEITNTKVLKNLEDFQKKYPNKLCLVNLFPYYRYTNWSEYVNYANTFAKDQSKMQLVCFDNYYPHSQFTDNAKSNKFYSNISLLKRLAGKRRLWSYVLTNEALIVDRDADWQASYMRLAAFAPMAYGATGILYYSYDTNEYHRVYRDLAYINPVYGWEESFFFLPDNDKYQLFLGHLRNKRSVDLAVKTSNDNGIWSVMYESDIKKSDRKWTATKNNMGNNSIAFLAVVDTLDKIAAITQNAQLLISNNVNSGWSEKINLQNFSSIPFNSIGESNSVAYGKFNDNNNSYNLCIAYNKGNTGYVRTYLNRQNNKFSSYKDITFSNEKILQFVQDQHNLWVVTRNTQNIDYIYSLSNGRSVRVATLGNTGLDHYWIEKTDKTTLYGQVKKSGQIQCREIGNSRSNASFTPTLSDYWAGILNITTKRRYDNSNGKGEYDLFAPMNWDATYPALIDEGHRTTIRYDYAKSINTYLKNYISKIVMNETWIGAFHSELPPNEESSEIQLIGNSSRPVHKTSEKILVGLFEANDGYDILIINKDNRKKSSGYITLRGDWRNKYSFQPRMDTGTKPTSTSIYTNSLTTITFNDINGGECYVLHLTK